MNNTAPAPAGIAEWPTPADFPGPSCRDREETLFSALVDVRSMAEGWRVHLALDRGVGPSRKPAIGRAIDAWEQFHGQATEARFPHDVEVTARVWGWGRHDVPQWAISMNAPVLDPWRQFGWPGGLHGREDVAGLEYRAEERGDVAIDCGCHWCREVEESILDETDAPHATASDIRNYFRWDSGLDLDVERSAIVAAAREGYIPAPSYTYCGVRVWDMRLFAAEIMEHFAGKRGPAR